MRRHMKKLVLTGIAMGTIVLTAIMTPIFAGQEKTQESVAFEREDWKLPYEDVAESDWFYDAVCYNHKAGTMTGMDASHFEPYGTLSRAQFALMLYRMEGEPEVTSENPFSDISGDEWYGQAVLWAQKQGVVTGYLNGCFGPADLITREQMAVMMYRYAQYKGYDVTSDGDYTVFDDYMQVSVFAKKAVNWSVGRSIITGKEGNLLEPVANTARAEAAAILQRYMNCSFEPAPVYELPKIVQSGTQVDDAGILTYISNPAIEDSMMQELYLFCDELLVLTFDGTVLELELVSLETGEVLIEKIITLAGEYNYSYTLQICGDRLAIADAMGGKVYVYDQNLEVVEEIPVSGDYVYVNTDLTEVYMMKKDSGIQKKSLKTGDTLNLLYNAYDINAYPKNHNSVTFSFKDGQTDASGYGALDLTEGTFEPLYINERIEAPEYTKGSWLAHMTEAAGSQYLTGPQERFNKLLMGEAVGMVNLLDESHHYLYSMSQPEQGYEITLYDRNGMFLSSALLKDSYIGIIGDPVWVPQANGYFFTSINENGYDQLYFWDLSKPVAGTDLMLIPYEAEAAVSKALYERAKQIGDKHGVVVNIADQVNTGDPGDILVELELDEAKIEKGLDWIDLLMSEYPTGMFGQIPFGSFSDPVEINLSGTLTRNYISDYDVTAFVSEESGYYALTISLDMEEYDSFASTFYHETGHLIDHKLQYDAMMGTNTLYSEEGWTAYNPEGFEYQDSYENEAPFLVEYLPHFFSSYSLTYAKEDRAVVFENAMKGNAYYFNERDYYGLNGKLSYFSACIRESFDTAGWPETTQWEQTLKDSDTAEPPFTGKG